MAFLFIKRVNGSITEKYLWQGLTRLLAVYDSNDDLIMRFEYVDGRMPVAMSKNGLTYYLTYDQVGSLRVVADAAGNVVKRIDYDSFGNIISDSDPLFDIPFGFAGGLHDRDVGLVRFGYRDYDPHVGRWTAKDPILFAGRDIDLYGYCLNDPVNLVDPTGKWIQWIPAAVGAALLAYELYEFLEQVYQTGEEADEAVKARDKLFEEIDKGIPDPEYAQKLKEEADKEEKEFLKELRETIEKGAACVY